MTYQTNAEIPQIPEPGEVAGWLPYLVDERGNRHCLGHQRCYDHRSADEAAEAFFQHWLEGLYHDEGESVTGAVTVELVQMYRRWEPTGRQHTFTFRAAVVASVRNETEAERIGEHWWATAFDAAGKGHVRRGETYAAAVQAAAAAAFAQREEQS